MENRSHALAAGIFVLLLGLAAALAIWFLGGKRESIDNYVLTTDRSVSGLNVQAQVRFRGIRAGKVESIETDPADPRLILVTIGIDDRFKLTKGTTAQLGYQGITGLAFIQLEDDGSNREFLDPDAPVTPRIAMKPTLLDSLGEKAGDIVTQISGLTSRLSKLLDERNTRNLSRTMENVAEASEGLRQLPQVVAALREALSADNLKRLHGILANVEKTAGEAAPLAAETREMVRSMTALAKRLDQVAGSEAAASTLPQLNALLKEVNATSRQLNRVLETLDESPQALVFGKGASRPGPGEAGFVAPAATEK